MAKRDTPSNSIDKVEREGGKGRGSGSQDLSINLLLHGWMDNFRDEKNEL